MLAIKLNNIWAKLKRFVAHLNPAPSLCLFIAVSVFRRMLDKIRCYTLNPYEDGRSVGRAKERGRWLMKSYALGLAGKSQCPVRGRMAHLGGLDGVIAYDLIQVRHNHRHSSSTKLSLSLSLL